AIREHRAERLARGALLTPGLVVTEQQLGDLVPTEAAVGTPVHGGIADGGVVEGVGGAGSRVGQDGPGGGRQHTGASGCQGHAQARTCQCGGHGLSSPPAGSEGERGPYPPACGPDAANVCRTALSLMITRGRPAVNGTRTKNLRFPAAPGPCRASTLRLHPEQEIQVALGTFDAAFAFPAEGSGHTSKKRSRGQVHNRLLTGRTSALPCRELHIQEVLRRNPQ